MMSPGEAVSTALQDLAAHKLRSLLTMLGMIFGVGAVIAMLAIGAGAELQALTLIERLGLSQVLVRAKDLKSDEAERVRSKSLGVSARDAAAIASALPEVERVVPRIKIEPYKVRSAAARSDAKVYGVSPDYARAAGVALAEGRFLDARDEAAHAQVCVLGAGVRRDLFGYGPAVGQDVKVNDVWLEVVGVAAPGGSGADSFQGVTIGSTSQEILVPASTAARKFDLDPLASPIDELVVRLSPGRSAASAASQIEALLSRLHAGERDYELVVPERLLEQSRRTQRLFNAVMASIAGISLLVGGIGIMNILLATVLERTREIGLRRAVGARSRDIRFQFVVEAFTISLIGGVAGILLGVGLARAVAAWAGWSTLVTPASVVLATGVATLVGLASGFYPAHRAASVDPIEALRYE
jgi:putative ABC transport system permease protein